MKNLRFIISVTLCLFLKPLTSSAQLSFNYTVELIPVAVNGLPGLHSYAYAQHNGRWLIIGGRRDGLHARQPFNAFPAASNNSGLLVVDIQSGQFWQSSVSSLPVSLREQLQSTNMNFYQDRDTLYIAGGYAYSETAGRHITLPYLTSVNVPALMNAIIDGTGITPYFKQLQHDNFAITGGQLGKIADTFLLVGGHRFDGAYNPFNNPTFTQTYSNSIRKFLLNNSGSGLSFSDYQVYSDPVHLHRRDYNLVPQIFPDRSFGYTLSSGVFRTDANLPYLYPVDIRQGGIVPDTGFSQLLSNYHSAKASLYDSLNNQMHMLFFGGMSQFYYQNGVLTEDQNVPFVKTISRLTRFPDGSLQEYLLPVEMPGLRGASAEFILNHQLPHHPGEIIQLSNINDQDILIGHIYGGINSTTLNPFTVNQTSTNTSASTVVYQVWLRKLTVVPVKFKAFSGRRQGEFTDLYWLMENATDRSVIHLQRSTDGRRFTDIAFFDDVVFVNGSAEQRYRDLFPVTAFYRVKMMDKLGVAAYSPVISVQAAEHTLRISPNPVRNQLVVECSSNDEQTIRLKILDMQGSTQISRVIRLKKGHNTFMIPVAGLLPGNYLINGFPSGSQSFVKF